MTPTSPCGCARRCSPPGGGCPRPAARAARLVRSRHDLVGELAHLSVPDLKEAEGGLRDADRAQRAGGQLARRRPARRARALPPGAARRPRRAPGRGGPATDRVAPELWDDLATGLGLADEGAAQVHVREHGRRITHLSRLTWRGWTPSWPGPPPRPATSRAGAAGAGGRPARAGRWCSTSARGRPTTRCSCCAPRPRPPSATSCWRRPPRRGWCATARRCPTPGPPRPASCWCASWPPAAACSRSGRPSRRPARCRGSCPSGSGSGCCRTPRAIHRFTVDRHVVETCIEASALIRNVFAPDVLMVAALLTTSARAGSPSTAWRGSRCPRPRRAARVRRGGCRPGRHARAMAPAAGETATTRDPDDPATVAPWPPGWARPRRMSLLVALTEADARATSPKAWTSWRAGLILDLGRRVLAELDPGGAPRPVAADDLEIPQPPARAGSRSSSSRRRRRPPSP